MNATRSLLEAAAAQRTSALALVVACAVVATGMRLGSSGSYGANPGLPAWMTGCWEARTPTDTLEEYWMAPRAATMLGMSRLVRKDAVVEYDESRIERRGSRVVLVSEPSTGSWKEYDAVALTEDTARFEWRGVVTERIQYIRRGDTLRVRYSQRDANGARGTEQPLTLAACPRG